MATNKARVFRVPKSLMGLIPSEANKSRVVVKAINLLTDNPPIIGDTLNRRIAHGTWDYEDGIHSTGFSMDDDLDNDLNNLARLARLTKTDTLVLAIEAYLHTRDIH